MKAIFWMIIMACNMLIFCLAFGNLIAYENFPLWSPEIKSTFLNYILMITGMVGGNVCFFNVLDACFKKKFTIRQLKEQLRACILTQDFEGAAKLRDEIKQLQK